MAQNKKVKPAPRRLYCIPTKGECSMIETVAASNAMKVPAWLRMIAVQAAREELREAQRSLSVNERHRA